MRHGVTDKIERAQDLRPCRHDIRRLSAQEVGHCAHEGDVVWTRITRYAGERTWAEQEHTSGYVFAQIACSRDVLIGEVRRWSA